MTDTYFALVAILLLIIILSGCSLLFFLLRNARFGGNSGGSSTGDLTNMMILFQSMRETVEQQKELARQLNLSIDRKVADVRKTIESAGDLKSSVKEAHKELDELVRDTKEELSSLNRRMGYLQEQLPGGGGEDDSGDDTEPPQPPAPTDSAETVEETHIQAPIGTPIPMDFEDDEYDEPEEVVPPLNAIASQEQRRPDFIDNWAGVDFGIQDAPEPAHVPEPTEPEDAESARDAFRALLDLKSLDNGEDFAAVSGDASSSEENLTPVQRRIYEFSDAGMRVPDIARELGVGKGEIKLILNMRESQA